MGGGGHAGAVSFRVQPQDEKEFLAKLIRSLISSKIILIDQDLYGYFP